MSVFAAVRVVNMVFPELPGLTVLRDEATLEGGGRGAGEKGSVRREFRVLENKNEKSTAQ